MVTGCAVTPTISVASSVPAIRGPVCLALRVRVTVNGPKVVGRRDALATGSLGLPTARRR